MDLSLADVLLAGANGTGGNFGTMTPQEEAVAITPGSTLDAIASHYAALPQRAFQASEDLRQGGDYNPAPAVETAGTMLGVGAPFAETGAVGLAGGKLFDYSRLRDVPDVPQFDLQRVVPPRGVPETATSLNTPENLARINKFVDAGANQGGLEWYNTQPLKEAFQAELGGDQGAADYARYLDYVAATSPRSTVGTNARTASYYYTLDKQGQPLPEIVKTAKGNISVPPGQIPAPYGSMAQALHVQNAKNIREAGGIPVLQNPKPPSFSQNLQGNQMPVTIDAHNSRMIGLPRDLPNPNEYGYLEDMQQGAAAAKGMTPAQYQASGWIGAGNETGLKSTADPFLKVFEDRVNATADARGLTPAEVLRQFIRGNAPLLSGSGLAGGAALDSQLTGVPDSR